jgi:N-acetyl-anhydromuramyl-L-alanine amidase AmpD
MPNMSLPLQKGDMGNDVVTLQKLLTRLGFPVITDGIFGNGTHYAVIEFQKKSGLNADGIVGPLTYAKMETVKAVNNKDDVKNTGGNGVIDEFYPLRAGQFVQQVTKKEAAEIHHTVSDGNPYKVIDAWNNDTRGSVATHFVIGREMLNGDLDYDGMILQCFDLKYWAHHTLTTRMGFSNTHNTRTNQVVVGIELCSFGALMKKDGKYYSLDGKTRIPDDQVCTLDRPFNTFKYWHKYTDAQLAALVKLVKWIGVECGIDFQNLVSEPVNVDESWFYMNWHSQKIGYGYSQPRLLNTHTNFEFGKFDCYPQPELLEAIKEIYGIK